jgi:sucrose phosphorylase
MTRIPSCEFQQRAATLLESLYGAEVTGALLERLMLTTGRIDPQVTHPSDPEPWSEKDAVLITYADMIREEGKAPLQTLGTWLNKRIKHGFSTLHLLPFCPWSSDDGFSVKDYRAVEPSYGSWKDIESLAEERDLMMDLVLNHASAQGDWFRDFNAGIAPARHYFIAENPDGAWGEVVRPRALPLFSLKPTREGEAWVWTTFSEDQVDLNWKNPDVLFEFLDILLLYLSKGMRMVRLDAVAFLWKTEGTNCVHLPQTHAIVKLLRLFLDYVAPGTRMVTETNVPQPENFSYFGEGDEAHLVYQFSLPPLLLHTLLRQDTRILSQWAKALPALPPGCTYFNFTASHDGIGLRPLQGLLSPEAIDWLIESVKTRGARISEKSNPDGSTSPYEINITYVDALSDPEEPLNGLGCFFCAQAITLAFKGIPGVYFNSIIAGHNNETALREGLSARSINRRKWKLSEIETLLQDPAGSASTALSRLNRLLKKRAAHPAFHPDSPMEILDLGPSIFAFTRGPWKGAGRIHCLFNCSNRKQIIVHPGKTLHLSESETIEEMILRKTIHAKQKELVLQPFQALWISAH